MRSMLGSRVTTDVAGGSPADCNRVLLLQLMHAERAIDRPRQELGFERHCAVVRAPC